MTKENEDQKLKAPLSQSELNDLLWSAAWHELKAAELQQEVMRYRAAGRSHHRQIVMLEDRDMHRLFAKAIYAAAP